MNFIEVMILRVPNSHSSVRCHMTQSLIFMAQEVLKVLSSQEPKNRMKFSHHLTKLTLSGNISVRLLDIFQFLLLCRWIGKGHSHLLTYCSVPYGFVILFYMNWKLYLQLSLIAHSTLFTFLLAHMPLNLWGFLFKRSHYFFQT